MQNLNQKTITTKQSQTVKGGNIIPTPVRFAKVDPTDGGCVPHPKKQGPIVITLALGEDGGTWNHM